MSGLKWKRFCLLLAFLSPSSNLLDGCGWSSFGAVSRLQFQSSLQFVFIFFSSENVHKKGVRLLCYFSIRGSFEASDDSMLLKVVKHLWMCESKWVPKSHFIIIFLVFDWIAIDIADFVILMMMYWVLLCKHHLCNLWKIF